ncbi:hypothetical protein AS574_08525 [Staphylococcus aureus]|nr:hypothetical protein AS574_08525 [Staphylococcus aureus]
MLNQRIIDIYRFVEKTISPSNLALEELFFMSKLKMIKNKIYIRKKPSKRLRIVKILKGLIRC